MVFVKGDPKINRGGRPKGSFSLVEMIKNKLMEVPEGTERSYAERFVEAVITKAMVDMDVSMMKDMIDRVDGKPRQNIGLDGGEAGVPISILNKVKSNGICSNNSNKKDNGDDQED